jgi:hypothetical protein
MILDINGQFYLIDSIQDRSGDGVDQSFRIVFSTTPTSGVNRVLTETVNSTAIIAARAGSQTTGLSYPGDPDKLRAFTSGTQAFEIDNNAVKFFNNGAEHLEINQTGTDTVIDTSGNLKITSDVVNISTHNGSKGLSLGGTPVTSDADDINRTDITTVGQSQNNKVLTQSASGKTTIGQTNGNQIFHIASHDQVDAGLMLSGTIVKSSAVELNKLDGATVTTDQLNFLTAPGLEKADLTKLAGVSSTAAQLNFLTATGLTKADLIKLAAINASAAEINDLYNNDVDGSDFSKLSRITSTSTELNLLDGSTTAGTGAVVAAKAIIASNDKSVSGINTITTTGNITSSSGRVLAVNATFSSAMQSNTASVTGQAVVGSLSSQGSIQGTTITGTTGTFSGGINITGGNLVTSAAGDINGGKNLNLAGNAYVTGEVHSSSASDIKLKSNLKKISNPLKKLSVISGYEFDWNEHDERNGQHDIGLVAQEVKQVLPEIVEEKANDTLGVKYDKMIPLLVECIKDQQKQIEYLAKLVSQK